MLAELNITDARKKLSNLFDQVYNAYQPIIIKRKQTENILVLRADLQKALLSQFSLKPKILYEEDGSITLSLDSLDIYVNGENLNDAVDQLINELKIYAQDYVQRSQLFLNAPNRRSHFPYILRILLTENDQELRYLLEL